MTGVAAALLGCRAWLSDPCTVAGISLDELVPVGLAVHATSEHIGIA